jgi:hypothetical protein
MITSLPRISPRSTARSVSCVQRCCVSSVGPELVLELAQQRLHVASDRAQLGRSAGGRPQDAFAAQKRAQSRDPSAPGKLRDHDGDQRHAQGERGEEVEEVPTRLFAAALDEAHVVHEHELRRRRRLRVDAAHGERAERLSRCAANARRAS